MGYDVHITRAENWAENEGHEISLAEWLALIGRDPDLREDVSNGPHTAIWTAHPTLSDCWLEWSDGNISTKNPDEALLGKMVELAAQLGARVQGDDGEWYPDVSPDADTGRRKTLPIGPRASLILSLVGLLGFAILMPLNTMMEQAYPTGTARPMAWALPLVGLMAATGVCWFASCLFALFSLITRLPQSCFAWVALVINGILFFAAVFMK